MNDFIRPFTEDEFNRIFQESGYPEIARQYCYEEWQEYFNAQATNLKEEIIENPEPYIAQYKKHLGWTRDTYREQIWENTKRMILVEDYVKQRKLGRGHKWAKFYCDYLCDYLDVSDFVSAVKDMDSCDSQVANTVELDIICADNELSRDKKIELLSGKKASLEKMLSEVDRLINKLQCEQATEIFENAARELNEKFKGVATFKMVNFTNPEMGFDLEAEGQLLHVTITFTEQQYWWRIYSTQGLEDTPKLRVMKLITPVMGAIKRGVPGKWDIYNSTSSKNCGLCLFQLAELFINATDFIVV